MTTPPIDGTSDPVESSTIDPGLQKKMDVSHKMAKYVLGKLKSIKQVRNKQDFAKEFVTTTKQLLKFRQSAGSDDLLVANINQLIELWKGILTTDYAKRVGFRLSDLRDALSGNTGSAKPLDAIDEEQPVL